MLWLSNTRFVLKMLRYLDDNNFESLYWMKHVSFRLAVINVFPVLSVQNQ